MYSRGMAAWVQRKSFSERHLRTFSKWCRPFLGYDPAGKRHMSMFFMTLGVLAVSLASVGDVPGWVVWPGLVAVVIAWMLSNAAAAQQRQESRASDFVEWMRGQLASDAYVARAVGVTW